MPPGLSMFAACLMKVLPKVNEFSCASWNGGFMMTVSKGRWWGTSLVMSVQWYSILLDLILRSLAHVDCVYLPWCGR